MKLHADLCHVLEQCIPWGKVSGWNYYDCGIDAKNLLFLSKAMI